MQKTKIVIVAIGVLFVLVLALAVGGYFFYDDYKTKIESLDQQNKNSKTKLESMSHAMEMFTNTIDTMSGQIKSFGNNMRVIEDRISGNDMSKKEMASQLESITREMRSFKDFALSVDELKEKIDIMKKELNAASNEIQKIDLGKISVDKREPSK